MINYYRNERTALLALFLATTVGLTANAAENQAEQQIKKLISSTYDKPARKVETSPVVVVDGYAIADWVQGENGGRALLHKSRNKWEIMACSGDSLKQSSALQDAGIPSRVADRLASELAHAEKSIAPEQLKRFGLFGSTKPGSSEHHQDHAAQK